jgi:hypothetical protein
MGSQKFRETIVHPALAAIHGATTQEDVLGRLEAVSSLIKIKKPLDFIPDAIGSVALVLDGLPPSTDWQADYLLKPLTEISYQVYKVFAGEGANDSEFMYRVVKPVLQAIPALIDQKVSGSERHTIAKSVILKGLIETENLEAMLPQGLKPFAALADQGQTELEWFAGYLAEGFYQVWAVFSGQPDLDS